MSISNSHVCDLCSSTSYVTKPKLTSRLGLLNTHYNVVMCKECHLVRLMPLPDSSDFSSIYDDYDLKYNRMDVEFARLENIYPSKLKKLRHYTNGNRLLDIGAGLGTFVHAAQELGFDAVGVEYSIGQCKNARNLWGLSLINGLLEEHYKTIGRFDIIHLHHVLEHVYSPKAILEIVYYLLNDNGICLIEVPNQFFSLKKELFRFFSNDCSPPANKLHHITFFSISTMMKYLKTANLSIIEVNQFRNDQSHVCIFRKLLRTVYRHFIKTLNIGGGTIIEVYSRKQ